MIREKGLPILLEDAEISVDRELRTPQQRHSPATSRIRPSRETSRRKNQEDWPFQDQEECSSFSSEQEPKGKEVKPKMSKPAIVKISVNDETEPDRFQLIAKHRSYDPVSLLKELSREEHGYLLEALEQARELQEIA